MKHLWRAPAAAVCAAILLAASPAAAAPTSGSPAADGADLLAISLDGNRLSAGFRDARQAAAGAAVTDPAGLTFGPAGGLATVVPAGPAYAFLGAPGQPVWSLSAGGSRFPSLDLTGVRPDSVDGGAVDLRLVSAEGPGDFAMYTVSAWGTPTVLLDSDSDRATARIPAGQRLGNVAWTFDTAGAHRLTFAAIAATDGKIKTETISYAVQVPPLATPAQPGEPAAQPEEAAARPQQAAPERAATQRGGATTQQQAKPEAAALAQQKQQQAQRKVFSDGHVDMGPQLTGGALRIKIKDDATSPPQWLELADVVLKVTDKARIPVPSGSGYAFLGKTGDQVWMLPQTQQSGIVWPGWNTQHESIVSGVSGAVTWTLKGVTGPGGFALFLTDSFGSPQVLFDAAKPMPQKLAVPLNTHAHGNWAFTKPGLYKLAVQMDAKTKAGKSVTDTRTLTIAVGDATDAEAGFGGGAGETKPGETKPTETKPGNGTTDTPAGGGTGTNNSGGALAKTGVNIVMIAGGGLLLLLAGAAALRFGRRRNPAP